MFGSGATTGLKLLKVKPPAFLGNVSLNLVSEEYVL